MSRSQSYTPEFRLEAIKLILEQELSYPEASKRLSVPEGTLSGWVHKYRENKLPRTDVAGSQTALELQAENAQLRKELAAAKMERDILKKAAAYFAKESLQSTRS